MTKIQSLKFFLKSHTETLLMLSAAIFIGVVIWLLYATIGVIVTQMDRSVVNPPLAPQPGFDLQNPARIDFRGISTSSPQSSTISGAGTSFPAQSSASATEILPASPGTTSSAASIPLTSSSAASLGTSPSGTLK